MSSSRPPWLIVLGGLLLLSGTAGLMYQVAWVRLLGLTFGVTLYAISTVLAAFMGGLALGSIFGGRWADRVRSPLRAYGIVEIGVAVTALLTPTAFSLLQEVYAGLARVVDPAGAPLVAGGVRAILAFAVLLVPTALMGATLPLAVRAVRNSADAGSDTRAMGLLYALNTTGAIGGTLLSGFVLIGGVGLSGTILTAAACNVLAGVLALLLTLGRTRHSNHADARHPEPTQDPSPSPRLLRVAQPDHLDPGLARAAFIAFGLSGALSLAYEVVWARALAILFDSSIYGFVLMLATVLLGIAVGGGLGGLILAWRPRARLAGLAFGWLEIGIGVAAVLALVTFGGVYDLLIVVQRDGPPFLQRFVRTETRLMAVLCVLTVLPASLLMGATFPVAARLWAAGAGRLGERLGGIYAANVGGAIVGSLAAGFLLVPLLGAHASLLLLAGGNVLIGAALLWVANRGRLLVAAVAGVAALAAIGWGATRPPLHAVVFRQHFPDQTLLAYWEGLENTVSVGRGPEGMHTLFTNSRGQTTDARDLVRYHRVMGHLAALLSPRANPNVLVVGIGGGATPGALAQHGGTNVEIIELSEAVLAAVPYFREANYDILHLPNVHISIDDGRNHLLRARRPYDVVTADVVPPYDAGSNNLYSVEYFRLIARALAPDGLVVQWVSPGSDFEHRLIVRTFLEVFPNSTLWLAGDLLIGSPQPLRVDLKRLEERLADPAARASLAEVGLLKPEDVLTHFRADGAELRDYAGSGPILSDDRPLLEYFQSLNAPPDPTDLSGFSSDESKILVSGN